MFQRFALMQTLFQALEVVSSDWRDLYRSRPAWCYLLGIGISWWLSSALTSGPTQSWQKPSGCLRWFVPFAAYCQGLFLLLIRAVDNPTPCFCPVKAALVGTHLAWWPQAAPDWGQWQLPVIAAEE